MARSCPRPGAAVRRHPHHRAAVVQAGEFTDRFLAAAAALRQGDPREDGTDIGPNITREHVARVDGFVRRAVAAGARPLLGGGPNPDLGGLYYQPTLLTGAAPGAEILTEEVFGPVLTRQTFSGEDEAVALANGTRYGLAAMLFTGDRDRAARVADRLVAGTVWVNCIGWLEAGDHARVIETRPEFLKYRPEARFGPYLMMIAALGADAVTAPGRACSEYENSVGTGQIHLWFNRPAEGWTQTR